ncbi:hypothetical protein [Solemya velesiana gill symbiont]|uniref:Uncharacterized protein n=1 Tax=Solemya velesiana gill symbiont TaxID=1918948 RepID=A0A1T2KSN8_9GAMM|nr:hypothetical protein [Solemya velesiana gill symbiont]OOZ35716.1 hypothetical protein BOW51_10670 [Solemya velesiana gill symbiont]
MTELTEQAREAALKWLPEWTRSQYFGLLLVLTLMLLAYPFWPRDILGLATLDILLWGVLLASIYAVSHSKFLLRVALLLAIPTFIADLDSLCCDHSQLATAVNRLVAVVGG